MRCPRVKKGPKRKRESSDGTKEAEGKKMGKGKSKRQNVAIVHPKRRSSRLRGGSLEILDE